MAKNDIKLEDKKFEELMEELELLIKDLENGNTDLDSTIKKYTEAMSMVKICSDKLENATEAVNKILQDNGNLEDFSIDSE